MITINLRKDYAEKMSGSLNELLSTTLVYYQNVRAYHWNITGKHFFGLHEKFEELYDDLAEKADEIAERILMLEGKPLTRFSDYLKHSLIRESQLEEGADAMVGETFDGLRILINKEREILHLAAEHHDEVTAGQMTDYMAGQEKLIWMLRAFLNK